MAVAEIIKRAISGMAKLTDDRRRDWLAYFGDDCVKVGDILTSAAWGQRRQVRGRAAASPRRSWCTSCLDKRFEHPRVMLSRDLNQHAVNRFGFFFPQSPNDWPRGDVPLLNV